MVPGLDGRYQWDHWTGAADEDVLENVAVDSMTREKPPM
jgi:hypothetical protein